MSDCINCRGEGLVHQGESIHKVCEGCAGTGRIADSVVTASKPAGVENDGSFLGTAGSESVPA